MSKTYKSIMGIWGFLEHPGSRTGLTSVGSCQARTNASIGCACGPVCWTSDAAWCRQIPFWWRLGRERDARGDDIGDLERPKDTLVELPLATMSCRSRRRRAPSPSRCLPLRPGRSRRCPRGRGSRTGCGHRLRLSLWKVLDQHLLGRNATSELDVRRHWRVSEKWRGKIPPNWSRQNGIIGVRLRGDVVLELGRDRQLHLEHGVRCSGLVRGSSCCGSTWPFAFLASLLYQASAPVVGASSWALWPSATDWANRDASRASAFKRKCSRESMRSSSVAPTRTRRVVLITAADGVRRSSAGAAPSAFTSDGAGV